LETQLDYEAVVHLAVFRSVESAQAGDEALRAAGIEHTLRPLLPGRYQVADPRLHTYTRNIVGAAIIGAIIGALIGIVFAVRLVGAEWPTAFFFAVAGAGGGAIVGSLVGLEMRARYDADVARTIDVPAEPAAVLISAYTGPTSPNHSRVREILEQAGATTFLDGPSYTAGVREAQGVPLE
jgi:hypothetical protein